MRKLFVLLVFLIALCASVAGQYYADIRVVVEDSGLASIEGLTNHPQLEGQTHAFTSKQGEHWLFNLSIDDVFEGYIVSLVLPQGAQVNYVRAHGVQILSEGERIVLRGVGSDEALRFTVQYSLETVSLTSGRFLAVALELSVFMVVFAAVAFFIVLHVRSRKRRTPDVGNARQNQILRALRRKGRMTQKELEKLLGLPKSSLSRNIESLRRRGLVKKESKGMVNVVSLSDSGSDVK